MAAAGTGSADSSPAHPNCTPDPLAATGDLPLWGKRVMLTGPRQYASKLAGLLAGAGARPIWLPTISISRVTDEAHLQELDATLEDLDSFSHVAFTSRNGIAAVLQRLEQLAGSHKAAVQKLAALGPDTIWGLGADAAALRTAGIDCSTPEKASTQFLAEALGARGARRVLCPVPHVAPPLVEPPVVPRFMAALEAAGVQEAVRVPAYVTEMGVSAADCLAERQMLEHGHIFAIAFSSTAEAQGLIQAMGGSRKQLAETLRAHHVILAAHGPSTATGVSETLGLPVTVVSQSYSTFDGLVIALSEAAAA